MMFAYQSARSACAGIGCGGIVLSTLKLHLLYERKQFISKLEARISVGEWIEAYYNRRRIHTSTEKVPKKAMDYFLTTPVATAPQPA